MAKVNTKKGPTLLSSAYTYWTDGAQSWLEVPLQDIKFLALENHITPLSFKGNGKVYLDKAADGALFLETYTRIAGSEPEIIEFAGSNFVFLKYPSYEP